MLSTVKKKRGSLVSNMAVFALRFNLLWSGESAITIIDIYINQGEVLIRVMHKTHNHDNYHCHEERNPGGWTYMEDYITVRHVLCPFCVRETLSASSSDTIVPVKLWITPCLWVGLGKGAGGHYHQQLQRWLLVRLNSHLTFSDEETWLL